MRGRAEVADILDGDDDRLLVVVGPCSVHDAEAARDYAASPERLRRQRTRGPVRGHARVLREAAHHDRVEGPDQRPPPGRLRRREHRACAWRASCCWRCSASACPWGANFWIPITPQYISDTVVWGAIGARTTESQIHRQLGSGLSMPVGFKNRTDGNVQVAVDAVRAAGADPRLRGRGHRRHAGDPAHLRQPRLPRDPARRQRRSPTTPPRAVEGALEKLRAAGLPERRGDRRLPRQQRQGPRAPARRRGRRGRPGGRRQRGDRGHDARVVPRRRAPGRWARRRAHLRPVDHRRVHGLGHHRGGAGRRWPAPCAPRRGA